MLGHYRAHLQLKPKAPPQVPHPLALMLTRDLRDAQKINHQETHAIDYQQAQSNHNQAERDSHHIDHHEEIKPAAEAATASVKSVVSWPEAARCSGQTPVS